MSLFVCKFGHPNKVFGLQSGQCPDCERQRNVKRAMPSESVTSTSLTLENLGRQWDLAILHAAQRGGQKYAAGLFGVEASTVACLLKSVSAIERF